MVSSTPTRSHEQSLRNVEFTMNSNDGSSVATRINIVLSNIDCGAAQRHWHILLTIITVLQYYVPKLTIWGFTVIMCGRFNIINISSTQCKTTTNSKIIKSAVYKPMIFTLTTAYQTISDKIVHHHDTLYQNCHAWSLQCHQNTDMNFAYTSQNLQYWEYVESVTFNSNNILFGTDHDEIFN